MLRISHNIMLLAILTTMFFWTSSILAQENYNLSPGKKIIITDATFKQGSAAIEDSQRAAFARLADFLKQRERLNIEVGGHADNVGSEQQNIALSLGRAEAVREFLLLSGIAASRIRTRGYGSEFPIASNDDEKGRTKNRRVEIIGLSAFSGKLLASPDGKALPPEARITMLKPTVRVMPAWESDWQEATIDQALYEAFKVSTAEGAQADITFRNKSVLHVSDDALLMIYGFDAAPKLSSPSRTAASDAIAKNIELSKGNLSIRLREMRSQDTFSIRTKVSEVGFNTASLNSSAKVLVDERERSIISVLEGRANVKVTGNDPRTGQTLDIAEEYGIIIGDSSLDSQKPRHLPSMPELLEPAERITPSESGLVDFRWSNGGLSARLEIAANIEFTELVYNQIRTTPSSQVNLPVGTYFIRLTTIDSIGFESRSRLRGLIISSVVPDKSGAKPFRFRYWEFGLLVIAGGFFWAGLLFNQKILKQIAAALVMVSIALLLAL